MRASSIRKGTVLMYNNTPHRVMEFRHHTPGNLRAMVQTKLRNLFTGNQTEVRFSSTEDIKEADVRTVSATYQYSDDSGFHFMNSQTYDQIMLSREILGDAIYYIQDNMEVDLTLFEENPIGIQLPSTVILTVIETEPELRGATASNSPKPAKTDTGLQLNVPAFIKIGEKIEVNTEDGTYVGRGGS